MSRKSLDYPYPHSHNNIDQHEKLDIRKPSDLYDLDIEELERRVAGVLEKKDR